MSNEVLKDAIDRSASQGEIVHCEWFGGDESDLVAEISTLYDDDIDSVKMNNGTIDIWGYHPDYPDSTDWRLAVTLTNESNEEPPKETNPYLYVTHIHCKGHHIATVEVPMVHSKYHIDKGIDDQTLLKHFLASVGILEYDPHDYDMEGGPVIPWKSIENMFEPFTN